MSREHKKPMLAFVVVAVACVVLVVNAARSSAVDLLRGPLPAAAATKVWHLVPGVEHVERPAEPAAPPAPALVARPAVTTETATPPARPTSTTGERQASRRSTADRDHRPAHRSRQSLARRGHDSRPERTRRHQDHGSRESGSHQRADRRAVAVSRVTTVDRSDRRGHRRSAAPSWRSWEDQWAHRGHHSRSQGDPTPAARRLERFGSARADGGPDPEGRDRHGRDARR